MQEEKIRGSFFWVNGFSSPWKSDISDDSLYEWLKEVFLDWAFTFMSSFLYYYDRDILDENALNLYRKGLACFEGNAPTYHLALREHPVIVWDFHSLMLTTKFMFSVKLTDAKNPMKLCEHCRMAFYAHRADSRYCSADCRSKKD